MKNMMKHTLLVMIICITTLPSWAQQAQSVFGEILVQLQPEINASEWLHDAQYTLGIDAHLQYKSQVSKHMRIHLLTFDETRIEKNAMIREVQHLPGVSIAQANHSIAERIIPDDPFFSQQWHHQQADDHDIDSELAWDITTGGTTASGTDIVVCVVEIGGAKWNTADIAANHWVNAAEIPDNAIDDDANGYVDDYDGWNSSTQNDNLSAGDHGTRVSSMIGAKGNNTTGIVGVNWDVQLMQVQIGSSTEAAAIAGYEYPLQMRRLFQLTQGAQGAFVVATNSSWGTDNGQPADAPLWCAMYDSLGYYGILNCASTTNSNANVDVVGDLPTACPSEFLIAVGRSNSSDIRASGGYGPNNIDLVAPGDNVYLANNTQYVNTTGTSFSSPCVAGGVALLYAAPCTSLESQALADPAWTAAQIRDYILDGVDTTTQLLSETVSGGRFNVNNSLQLALQHCENGACLQPYNLSILDLGNHVYQFSWNTVLSGSTTELRYKNIAQTEWTIVSNLTELQTQLEILDLCALYEAQVRTICTADSSSWSGSIYWTTDGCCSAPASINIVETGVNSCLLNWQTITAAATYSITSISPNGDSITVMSSENSLLLENLSPCTTYVIEIRTQCADTLSAAFTSTTIYTGGCDACNDLNYCSANATSTAEHIALVSFNGYQRTSASDGGYIQIIDPIIDLVVDSTYTLTVAPGYSGNSYNENFRAWIDYNADGAFNQTNELIFDPTTPTTTSISGTFTIPANATPGVARMRVAMSYTPLSSNVEPQNCGTWQYGEVEDYCVRILDAVSVSEIQVASSYIYPMPARDAFRIAHFNGHVIVRSARGECVASNRYSGGDSIDISGLAAGYYVVTLISSESSISLPLIVVR